MVSGAAERGEANEIRTFLIADVRGYTRFTQERGDEAAARLAGRFAELVREQVSEWLGAVTELRGDEALCVFSSPRNAVRAAVTLQRRFADEIRADPDLPLRVGIGLDAGEAVPVEGGYRGGALNLAARLCSKAAPGEVLVSEGIVHLAGKVDQFGYLDRGRVEMKGMREPVRFFAVAFELDLPAGEDPPPSRRFTSRRVAGLAVSLVGLLVVALAFGLRDTGQRPQTLAHDSVARIDPASGQIVADVAVGGPPGAVTIAAGYVWVTDVTKSTVSKIDPGTNAIVDTVQLGPDQTPSAITAGDGLVWVACAGTGTVVRINPSDGDRIVGRSIRVGNAPSAIAVGAAHVWVTNALDGTVSELEPGDGKVVATIRVGVDPEGVAVRGESVWVSVASDGQLVQIDPSTRRISQTFTIGSDAAGVALDGRYVWVAAGADHAVVRVDPGSAEIRPVGVPGHPVGLAVGGGEVWVTDGLGGAVTRLDPRRVALVSTVHTGAAPQDVAVSGSQVWITAAADARSRRGGTLRLVGSAAPPSLDTTSLDSPWSLLNGTNDGLVGYRRVGGAAGSELVPDLATSLPRPSDGGHVYVFHLRPGIYYSTGGVVRPSDVRASIERVYKAHSVFAFEFDDIVGGTACERQPASCDLSDGIATDQTANTVTFHLTAPEGDFLHRLSLAAASILPAATPTHDVGLSPLPATGPYMFERPATARELVVVRNPRFQMWSTTAQPDGYPDRIEYRFGVAPTRAASMVIAGTNDGMFEAPPAGMIDELATLHSSLFHSSQSTALLMFVFNTRLAPFTDARVRQALNYAINRDEVVNLYGGSYLAQPTCQVVPPNLPGYRPYCPYTKNPPPGAAGPWTAPNMARARALVAASGTRGAHVSIWGRADHAEDRPVVSYLASLLRRLGYRTSTVFKSGYFSFYTSVLAPHSNAQVVLTNWAADIQTASNFINPLFACSGVGVTDPTKPFNLARWCQPALDREIAQGLRLQAANKPQANDVFSTIDRELVDQAVWLPLVVPKQPSLTSTRVGNFQYNPQLGVLLDQLWVR